MLATVHLGERLPGAQQAILELRLWRALCAGFVGASLALSGALLQGLFRNGLAVPSILGVTSGSTLGATVAILVLGGYGPALVIEQGRAFAPYAVSIGAFVGALAAGGLVVFVASTGGRPSIAMLLLTGVAVNSMASGLVVALQSLVTDDWEVSRALLFWTFGMLDDRQAYHVAVVGIGLAVALACLPFVSTELDLFAGGEEDARRLGVRVGRVKALVLAAACLTTACAVATAGSIAFVGLIVPHGVRLVVGRGHRNLLPLSALAGAVFLLGTDAAQVLAFGTRQLPPGVVMSLLGAPLFIGLLFAQRRRLVSL